MSYIQFESSRDKEKIRQELREAREQMLDKAKKIAEARAERSAQKQLSGEANWMLPAVAEKFKKLSKAASASSASTTKHNKKTKRKSEKKSKHKIAKKEKKSKKRRHHSTSSSEDSSDSDSDSSTSSSDSAAESKEKSKRKKSKKSKKKVYHKPSTSSSASEDDSANKNEKGKRERKASSASDEGSEWVERPPVAATAATTETVPLQRDNWMTDALMLKTYSREPRVERKPNEQQRIEAYDPATSARELNPHWKTTGTGMPAFQKPRNDSDEEAETKRRASRRPQASTVTARNWQKKSDDKIDANEFKAHERNKAARETQRSRGPTPNNSSLSDDSSESVTDAEKSRKTSSSVNPTAAVASATAAAFLTDQQMNELGAKILKAEIMGNADLAAELKQKLENARSNRAAFKERKQEVAVTQNQKHAKKMPDKHAKKSGADNEKEEDDDEHILLSRTDERGNCRPLAKTTSQFVDPRDLYGGRKGRKQSKQKRVETHAAGERVRYFADDDKYDIKQMFEREKYANAADSNLQFAEIAGTHKNPNDDLEDIFADKIRKSIADERTEESERQRAIHEHHKLEAQLDNCERCFDSHKMDKKLLVAMGQKVYLALPWYVGLQTGHCVIVPTAHTACCTQLDEDTWAEVQDFRKALTRMFAAQRKDVIFFEIANKLQRRPHLAIHCVPIAASQGELAPFYFKKAIEESEQEWSVNKQLVSLRREKGLRASIPRGLPYFWVHFGMDAGFAHVIEDEQRFPANYAQEIIGGLLQLDANKWRKPQKEQNIIAKVKLFADWWRKYDCTV